MHPLGKRLANELVIFFFQLLTCNKFLLLNHGFMVKGFLLLKVCPMLSAPLIKKILDNFVPDEFCPDPIPAAVFEALDSQVR